MRIDTNKFYYMANILYNTKQVRNEATRTGRLIPVKPSHLGTGRYMTYKELSFWFGKAMAYRKSWGYQPKKKRY